MQVICAKIPWLMFVGTQCTYFRAMIKFLEATPDHVASIRDLERKKPHIDLMDLTQGVCSV